ncbi:MAG: hypothetical protein IKE30_04645, partial [Clostridia bacterium]|nr:hypothetical protein [Clostridia bacterium]
MKSEDMVGTQATETQHTENVPERQNLIRLLRRHLPLEGKARAGFGTMYRLMDGSSIPEEIPGAPR